MDYKTKSISRNDIRTIALVLKFVFKECVSEDGLYIDVVKMFELVHDKCSDITVEVVDDEELGDIPGRCTPDFKGHYHIQVKETVYEGAVNGIGGYRTHILHELSHAFLCMLGFTPICDRSFKPYELLPYESMEWQAKALTGEIMMDYVLTEYMSVKELIKECGVSEEGALNRVNRKHKRR